MYQVLCDENIEHEIRFRLENYGHDVEHVDAVSSLGKGTTDEQLAAYSRTHDRLLLTYDDDFVHEFVAEDYRAVLYIPDLSIPAVDVADVVHEMSKYYPQSQVHGVERVTTEWI